MNAGINGNQPVVRKRQGTDKAKRQRAVFLFLAVAPSLIGYFLFTLYPNVMSVYYSLLDWDGLTAAKYVGFDNYVNMVKDQFVWRALYHNLLYMIVVPALIVFISLLLAYLLNNKSYKENAIYKVLFFFTNVLSTVVIALLWSFIFDGSFGLLNGMLELFGLTMDDFYWLGDSRTAFWVLVLPMVWGGVGLYVVIFINAMSAIPKSLYEAAVLEGARPMTILFRITIPLLRGVIRVCVVFVILGSIKGFEIIMILTNGGPEGSTDVIGLYMFNLAFGREYHNYGYASAIGMFLFVILVGAKLIIDKLFPEDNVEF
ncbi:binding-protein-dependent transport systems inner membrane component [Paenibacillus baekrokdamisoli]|uniref:Binding-protein-dependent transport systems inner membrane component n=1 Tax=Paenibacillus baekrokdamisoli TaxID=1712516 RepID=A0A3G9IS79_9BACL|nr:sugar ABC transporter permease [Paenibacillus baekrokdamisoli]MBB3073053.1 ABC-type sugar transport system permease subunit [Paenibacillus baekrokdamisoli]BBH21710.1 binding-protein-dependent transport systems inner membrane component [Paenibacillus baekrokdamisoli]